MSKTAGMSTFRRWLSKQPRRNLTYEKHIPNHNGKGWTTEDFVNEARKRGLSLKIMTAYTWCRSSDPAIPGYMTMNALEDAFAGISKNFKK